MRFRIFRNFEWLMTDQMNDLETIIEKFCQVGDIIYAGDLFSKVTSTDPATYEYMHDHPETVGLYGKAVAAENAKVHT